MTQDSSPSRPSRTRLLAVTGAAVLAGVLAEVLHLPAGSLLAGMLVALVGTVALSARIPLPVSAQFGASCMLGAALCSAFRPSAWAALASHWPVALINVVGVVAVSQAVALGFSRLSGLGVRTTTLGLMPGGAPSMVALSEELGADSRMVALFQYVRLVAVIIVASLVGRWAGAVPDMHQAQAAALPGAPSPLAAWGITLAVAVIGGWLGVRLKLPAGIFLGPILLGMLLSLLGVPVGALPPGLLPLGLWILGVRVGNQFDASALRAVRRLAPAAVGAAMLVVAGCVLLAWAWSSLGGVDLLTAYFATSPGGMDSVLAIALGTHATLSIVLAVQLGRIILIFLFVPPFLRKLSGLR
jgi:membrane AbrB-like protein